LEIKENRTSGHQVELTIEVPYDRWEKIVNEAYDNYRRSIKLNGFRPGKVPMAVIKRMFGRGIEAEAAEKNIDKFYREAIDKADIEVIAPGDITEMDYGKNKPFTFKAVVEVMPVLTIKGLDEMSTFLEVVEVEEDDIEVGMEVLREEAAILLPHKAPIKEGSVITADVQEVDQSGIPLLSHSWKDITIQIGKNIFGADADKQFLGLSAGDQVSLTFDHDDPIEVRETGEVHYLISIKDVKKKELPEINDDFARSVSESFKTVDDLQRGVNTYLNQQANSRARVRMFFRLVDFMVENNRVEVPPSMLKHYLNRMLENARKKEEEILDEEDFRNRYRLSAIRNLKWFIIRKNIIDQFGLTAEESEIEEEINRVVQRSGGDKEVLTAQLRQEKNEDKLKGDIEEHKVLKFLESKTEISTRKVKYRDFVKEDTN